MFKIILFCFFIFGCGNDGLPDSKTILHFRLPKDKSVIDGGLMIYIRKEDGSFIQAISLPDGEDSSVDITLENGGYRFFGVSFDGPSDLFGQGRCALSNNGSIINLNGGEQFVDLNFSTNGCQFSTSSIFSNDPDTAGNFRWISTAICTPGSTLPGSCINDGSYFNATGSIEVVLNGYKSFNGDQIKVMEDSVFSSDCATFDGSAVGNFSSPGVRIPLGNPNMAFGDLISMSFRVYPPGDDTCSTTPIRVYDFPYGVSNYTIFPGSDMVELAAISTVGIQIRLLRDF